MIADLGLFLIGAGCGSLVTLAYCYRLVRLERRRRGGDISEAIRGARRS